MKYLAYSLIVIICFLNAVTANAKKSKKVSPASFIRIDGQNLIAPGDEKFFIKGTNLGNWLNPEGYMFLFKKTSAPRLIDQAFKEMVGPDFTNEFLETIQRQLCNKGRYQLSQKNRNEYDSLAFPL